VLIDVAYTYTPEFTVIVMSDVPAEYPGREATLIDA
jgi:hypothetical protein